ncbi:DNA (cytosine-5-)-methyltransferase [Streptomyces sp. NPDC056161]|uniref:DNA (cytosine-5-)-methyltransferase n=1 Tax=Streptomyces sp. NPDC056161 TaxID=3345732 RepID=UPI0035D7811C
MAKPPYRVPTMEEIRAVPWNGFNAISTFSGCGGSSLGDRMAGFRMLWASEFIPAAQDTYRANAAPYTVLDGRDIREVTAADICAATGLDVGELDLYDGSPPCFPAGTPVLTSRGLVPIEEVKVGDQVLTHANRWRPVTHTMSRTALVSRTTWAAATPDHPFWARRQTYRLDQASRNYRRALGAPEWTPAGELGPEQTTKARRGGWYVALPAAVPSTPEAPPLPSHAAAGAPFWWMVGRWLGDGWLRLEEAEDGPARERPLPSRTPRDCVSCGAPSARSARHENLWTAYCSERCRKAYGRKLRRKPRAEVIICCSHDEAPGLESKLADTGLRWSSTTMRTAVRFSTSSAELAPWLREHFGSGAAGKTIPAWLLSTPAEARHALLDGYLSAHGHLTDTGTWTASSVSTCLAVGIRLLGTSLGYTTSLARRSRPATGSIEGRTINQRDAYSVRLAPDDGRYSETDGTHRWVKVRHPFKPGEPETVYDLTVADDHSFTAWGVVVHNCAAFSTMGKREAGWGQVKAYSDTRQRVDDLFFEYTRILKELQPRTFVAENVSGLVKGTAKGYFLEILAALKAPGYRVEARLLDASRLGVPQSRQRLIFVGVREDLDMAPAFPQPLPYQYTVRDALPAMPRLVHDTSGERGQGDVTDKPSPAITVGVGGMNSRHFQVHDPAPDGGVTHDPETGKDITISRYAIGEAWRETPPGGSSERFFSLKRNHPDRPSQTITAEGGNVTKASVTHYAEARKLTLGELRAIGGFPPDFELTGTYEQRWERIGRAVPPVMMSHIAAAVRDQVLIPLRERGVI